MASVPPPDPRRLALGTLAAAGLAAVVLVAAVLPAEYGIDPTGIGEALGLTKLSETPAPPAIVEAPPAVEETTYAFDARWVLAEREVGNWTGDLSGVGDQDTIRVPLRVANLTKLTARLTWIDDAPASGPDVLEVSVRGPRGRESDLAQGDAGFANATLQWRSAPFPAARDGALVLENATDESSFAEWRVVIRLYGTGATADAPDPGNAYVLRLFAESYRLETRVEGGAADRVALTLAPRGQVEYKFAMEENATMAYRWTATARVHSDLHADTAEDPETAVSAKVADLDGDSGDYRAPFRGRHGWYFRNDNAFPVTITLETRGDYRILGVVS